MSATEREVVVRLLLQAAAFNRGTTEASTGLAGLQDKAAKTSAEFKHLEAEASKAAADLKRLEAEAVKTAAELRKLQEAERSTAIASAHLTGEVKQLTDRLKALEGESNRTQAHLHRMEEASKKAAAEMRSMEAESKRLAGELARMHQQSTQAAAGLGSLASVAGPLKAALAALGIGLVAKEALDLGLSAINAAEDLNKLKGSITAIVAANSEVRNSSGELVNGVEKIKAVGKEVEAVFAQLQVDGLKTSDTTQGLIEKFSAALAPGQAAGMDLDKIRKLTVAASVAMSSLNIEASQARSEIRALLTGDELDNAQLAQALGFRSKADIEKLRAEGKLYDVLMVKMQDFLAAGEIQSRGLTGILSSLDDFRLKMLALAGDDATDILAKGFGDVLDMVQNADGSLTPLGEHIKSVAAISGEFVGHISDDFIDLIKWIAKAGEKVDEIARTMKFMTGSIGKYQRDTSAIQGIYDTKIKVGGKSMTVGDAIAERDKAVSTREGYQAPEVRVDAARRAGVLNAALKPYDFNLERLRERGKPGGTTYDDEAADEAFQSGVSGLERGKPGGKDENHYKRRAKTPPPKVDPNAGKKANQAEDKRIAAIVKEMRQELSISDAKDLGFTGRIQVMEKYRAELIKHKRAMEEVDALDHDLTIAKIERGKKQTEEAKKEAQKLVDIAKDGAEAQAKINARYRADELAGMKAGHAAAEASLKEQFDKNKVTAEEYYDAVAQLRQAELDKEYANTVAGLEEQRAILQKQFEVESGRTGKDYNSVKVEGLKNDVKAIADELNTAGYEYGRNVSKVWNDARQDVRIALEEGSKQGMTGVASSISTILAPAVGTEAAKSIGDAMLKAAKMSGIGKQFFAAMTGEVGEDLGSFASNVAAAIDQAKQSADNRRKLNNSLDDSLTGDTRAGDQDRINRQLEEMGKEIGHENAPWYMPWAKTPDEGQASKLTRLRQKLEEEADEKEAKRRKERSDANEAQEEENYRKDVERLEKRRQKRLATLEEERDFFKKVANDVTKTAKFREEAEERVWAVEQEIMQKRADEVAREAGAMEAAAQRQRDVLTDAYRQAADGAIEQLRRIRAEQENALADQSTARQVRSIYGLDSAALSEFRDKQDAIKLKQDQIRALAKRNSGLTNQQGSVLNTYASDNNLRFFNATGANLSDPLGGTLQPGQFGDFMAEFHTFASDMQQLLQFNEAGGMVIDRRTGRELSRDEINEALAIFNNANSGISSNQSEITNLSEAIAGLKRGLEVQYATIRQGATDAGEGLEAELMALQAGDDPEKLKALKKAQIDAEIEKRRKALEQAGILGGDVVGAKDQADIKGNLEKIRSLMKEQVDKAPSESNPLPVRVVEMPRTFALPTSAYFRERAPVQSLSVGQIQVNGSGLNQTDLQAAIVGAIQKAPYQVTKTVNRENSTTEARITL